MTEPSDTIADECCPIVETRDNTGPAPKSAGILRHEPPGAPLGSFVDLVSKLPTEVRAPDQSSDVEIAGYRYETLRSLGDGAMGTVVLARDRDIGRKVAIKRLHDSSNAKRAMRFAREVQALGGLEHPGIVPIHDVGRNEDGSFFVVMKHISGDTLEKVIEQLKAGDEDYWNRYDFARRIQVCQALVETLCFAHAQGFIHRDIKPSNIMVGDHGQVTLIDWGLAKSVRDEGDLGGDINDISKTLEEVVGSPTAALTQAGARMGTPLYMSPEQAAGRSDDIGPQSDIYSLAVVCYELLSLTHYLEDMVSIADVLEAVQSREPKLAYWHSHSMGDRMPIEFAYWIKRAMRKDLPRRFSSAEEMRLGLEAAVNGNYEVVCPTTFARRLFHSAGAFANQRPMSTMLLAAGAVGAVIANVIYLIARLL